MWLHEVAVGGLLFSPMLTFILAGLLLTWLCYRLLLVLGWHQRLWASAWFYLSVFICSLAMTLGVMG